MSTHENKNDLLQDVLGSLSDGESEVMEKTASCHSGIVPESSTEDVVYPKRRVDSPVKAERKLGLAGLSAKGGNASTENLNYPGDGYTGGLSAATENVNPKQMPVDKPSYLSKRASIYNALSEATGIGLEKVAGDINEEEFLLKRASEILQTEADNLEKLAISIADVMYERFSGRLGGH